MEDLTPPDFICPISQDIMEDPVICVDGNSYERNDIEKWLVGNNISPLTGETLSSKNLIPNQTLKRAIILHQEQVKLEPSVSIESDPNPSAPPEPQLEASVVSESIPTPSAPPEPQLEASVVSESIPTPSALPEPNIKTLVGSRTKTIEKYKEEITNYSLNPYTDICIYNGEVIYKNKKEIAHGYGVLSCKYLARGYKYTGNFHTGKRHNYGEEEYYEKDGNSFVTYSYKGKWKNNQKDGKGIMKTNLGTYIGIFNKNKLHGACSFTSCEGDTYQCTFKYGFPKEGYCSFPLYINYDNDENFTAVYISGNKNDIYIGNFKNGKKHGQGVEYKGYEIYDGQWENDQKNGYGVYSLSNVILPFDKQDWKGNWKDDKKHGYFEITYKKGNISNVKCNFRFDEKHGQHIETFNDGSIHDINYKNGMVDGKAVFTSCDGNTHEGNFKNGKPQNGYLVWNFLEGMYYGNFKDGKKNGYGKFTYKNGNVYDGEWKDDKKNGKGVLTLPNGKYDGGWKDDKKNGKGVLTLPNGNVYEGTFKDDKIDGLGVYKWANGDIYVGNYEDGKKNYHGKFTSANGLEYDGEYKDDNFNGPGELTYENGDVYKGKWKDGKRNGYGILMTTKYRYEGIWKGNKMHGHGMYTTSEGESCKYFNGKPYTTSRKVYRKVIKSVF